MAKHIQEENATEDIEYNFIYRPHYPLSPNPLPLVKLAGGGVGGEAVTYIKRVKAKLKNGRELKRYHLTCKF